MTATGVDARLAAARRAVADACAVCRAVQRSSDEVRSVAKDDRSPVTVADFASQAVVAHRLREAFGEVHLVGEEDASTLEGRPELLEPVLNAVRLVWPEADEGATLEAIDLGGAGGGAGGFWTLDPIDGTKGFLRGQQYAVSLAWIEGGRPTLGLLGCPNLPLDPAAPLGQADDRGSLYLAHEGGGAWEAPSDDPDATPVLLRRRDADEVEAVRVCESVESGHSSHGATAQVLEAVGRTGEPSRLDSQCKYAVVARGQADAYLRMPTKKGYVEKIWDHAAGALMATEAGCSVSDIRGEPLDFSLGRGLERNLGVICAAPSAHRRIIGAIADLGLDRAPD